MLHADIRTQLYSVLISPIRLLLIIFSPYFRYRKHYYLHPVRLYTNPFVGWARNEDNNHENERWFSFVRCRYVRHIYRYIGTHVRVLRMQENWIKNNPTTATKGIAETMSTMITIVVDAAEVRIVHYCTYLTRSEWIRRRIITNL